MTEYTPQNLGEKSRTRATGGFIGRIRRLWRQSLQFRTVASAAVLLMVSFIFVGSFLSHQIANSLFRGRLDQALEESTSGFSNVQSLLNNSDSAGRTEIQRDVLRYLTVLETGASGSNRQWLLAPLEEGNGSAGFISEQSQFSNLSATNVPQELRSLVATQQGVYWQSGSLNSNGEIVPVLIVGSRVSIPQNPDYGLYLFYNLSDSQNTMNYINIVVWLGFTTLLIVVVSIVWATTRYVIKPISSTAITAEKLAAGDLNQRVVVRGTHEASRLGSSFNKMADSLQDQISRLERLSTMQQRFVSDVSHELRTPLTTVRMAAEMLYDGREQLEPAYRRPTELLFNQVDRFDNLLADLLEISRFDAGSATLEVVPVEFMAVMNDVITAAEPHARKAGSEIRVHTSLTELTVVMDHRRIERVLRNLLFNAIEHSEGKNIDIYIATNETSLGVAVRDHGLGLDKEHIAQVFNRFWRADPSRKRTLGGTGLGLSIAAEDVRLHHGSLQAWGRLGVGACFRMTIPLTADDEVTDSPVLISGEPDRDDSGSLPAISTGAMPKVQTGENSLETGSENS